MTGRRLHPCIVTFIGPVGSGKSTQISLLQKHLKSKNIPAVRTFIKSNHAATYLLSRLLRALGASERVNYKSGFSRVYPRRAIVRRLFRLWRMLDTMSIASKFLLTVSVPFHLGFTVLMEEGLSMSLYTYSMSFPSFFKTKPAVLPVLPSLLGWITRVRHVNIILDAPDEELDQRRKGRDYRQIELDEYVSMQKKWIKRLKLVDAVNIDTRNASALDVHKKVVAVVEKLVLSE